MTTKELRKVKFRWTGHVAMTDEYVTTYVDESGRLGFCDRTERLSEFETGKTKREYRFDNKWYKTFRGFLNAIKDLKL